MTALAVLPEGIKPFTAKTVCPCCGDCDDKVERATVVIRNSSGSIVEGRKKGSFVSSLAALLTMPNRPHGGSGSTLLYWTLACWSFAALSALALTLVKQTNLKAPTDIVDSAIFISLAIWGLAVPGLLGLIWLAPATSSLTGGWKHGKRPTLIGRIYAIAGSMTSSSVPDKVLFLHRRRRRLLRWQPGSHLVRTFTGISQLEALPDPASETSAIDGILPGNQLSWARSNLLQ